MKFLVQPEVMDEMSLSCQCWTIVLCSCLTIMCSLLLKHHDLDL